MPVSRPKLALVSGLGLCALWLCGCSGDAADGDGDGIADGVVEPNNVTVIAPTKPTGHVAGEVRDASTDRPIAGAAVKLLGGGVEGEAVTDESGAFKIGPIAAGATFAVRISAMGRIDATVTGVVIDDAAGNFPTANGSTFVGPVGLLGAEGSFSVQVVSEDGAPLSDAAVAIETATAFFVAGTARGTGIARGTTDASGLVRLSGLPDVFALPPRLEAAAALTVQVSPVDLDDDGTPDYDGAVLAIAGPAARNQSLPPVIVLRRPGVDPLRVVASNLSSLAGSTPAQPSILPAGDAEIRVVFNKPIDRDSVLIDLRTEDGSDTILTAVVTSGLDNVLTIDPAEALAAGQEYNIAVRAQSRDSSPTEALSVAGAFLIADNRDSPIVLSGRFADLNGNLSWGDGNDAFIFSVSAPIGRPGASPAFFIEVWVSADLNNDGLVGNATGELPGAGNAYPPPAVLAAAEPSPGNGAGGSGYTRFIQPLGVGLIAPLGQASGAVGYELRITADRNDGRLVTTGSGRQAPTLFTASAALVAR